MAKLSVSKNVNVPIATLWESWSDFANIYKFHPDIKTSFLLGEQQPTGLGALRQCNFTDGKTFLKERIIGYEPGKKLVLDIYESNAPIKSATATFEFSSTGTNRSHVDLTFEFEPKMGLLGRLLVPLMKKQFSKGLVGLLNGNASYVNNQSQMEAAA